VNELEPRARFATDRLLTQAHQRFLTLTETLDALSPLGVLDRGFAVCRTSGGRVVREAGDVAAGDPIEILTARARVEARVTATATEWRSARPGEGKDG
jgi:exodeoxyribonuclease VII large subunit